MTIVKFVSFLTFVGTSLIVASVIHNRIPDDLVKPEARPSIELYSPNLFQPSTWQSKSPRTHESHHSKKSSSKSHHHHHEKGTRDSPRNLIGKKDKKLKDSSGIETSKSLTSSTVSEVAK